MKCYMNKGVLNFIGWIKKTQKTFYKNIFENFLVLVNYPIKLID